MGTKITTKKMSRRMNMTRRKPGTVTLTRKTNMAGKGGTQLNLIPNLKGKIMTTRKARKVRSPMMKTHSPPR